ncbi:MAG: HAMP domain-containing sensor histidine kinase [Bacteroidota bacterium]
MKRSILWVFILMSLCVAGITALQLYYSYKSYAVESAVFERNINEGLEEAVDSMFSDRHKTVLKKLRGWLTDTTFVTLSCKWQPENQVTVFKIKQVVPSVNGQNEISMSLDYFPERVNTLTPKARQVFLDHMDSYVADQLKKGFGWYYTQKLGDSINKAAFTDPHDMNRLRKRYKQALHKRGIDLPFSFNLKKRPENSVSTEKVNIAIGRPQKEEWLQATLTDTNMFLLKQLQWLLAGSILLFAIMLACFWYTIKTLLSQQKLNALKDDFISNMTHEIHTPLTSIGVTAQALKQFAHSPEEQQNYLDIIVYQSNKLNVLTDEILAGAKLGNVTEGKESVDVNGLIDSVLQGLGKDISRIEYVPCNQVALKAYKIHLVRALGNLIDNALKYSDSSDKITVTCIIADNKLHIAVADNGPGIAPEYRTKVFDTFYRIPTGNVHNIKGYGLGLSYVKKVADMHKGSVAITDNTSQGAIFTLTLPL